jgi:hypothetical protein
MHGAILEAGVNTNRGGGSTRAVSTGTSALQALPVGGRCGNQRPPLSIKAKTMPAPRNV